MAKLQLLLENNTLLTDASATFSQIVDTSNVATLVVDVNIDKGSTIVVTPVLSDTDDTRLGKASVTTTIPVSGSIERVIYNDVLSLRMKVVITKTEAGDATTTQITITGQDI